MADKPKVSVITDKASMSKKITGPLNAKIKRFNSKSPEILRQVLFEVWSSNAKTRKYAQLALNLKSEVREVGEAKVGTGLKLRIENNEASIRVILTPGAAGKGYWPIVIPQEGREALPKRGEPYALAIKTGKIDRAKLGNRKISKLPQHEGMGRGYKAIFASQVKKVPKKQWDWMKEVRILARKRIKEFARKL